MSKLFKMQFHPDYQYRTTECKCCGQPIRPGEKVVIGTTWYQNAGKPQRKVTRYHYEPCFKALLESEMTEWFHTNQFVPEKTPYSKAKRLKIGRLNYHLWHLRTRKGVGDEDPRIQIILQQKEELQFSNNGKEN